MHGAFEKYTVIVHQCSSHPAPFDAVGTGLATRTRSEQHTPLRSGRLSRATSRPRAPAAGAGLERCDESGRGRPLGPALRGGCPEASAPGHTEVWRILAGVIMVEPNLIQICTNIAAYRDLVMQVLPIYG